MTAAQLSSQHTVKNSFQHNLKRDVLRADSTLDASALQKVIADLKQSEKQGHSSLEKLEQINDTLNKLIESGRISPQKSRSIKKQIGKAVEKSIDNNTLQADKQAAEWLKFGGGQRNNALRTMAQNAAKATNDAGQHIDGIKTKDLLKKAAKNGTISLNEINSMYKGIHDAFRDGQISAPERNQAIKELDTELTTQAGARKGGCGNRQKGSFADKLNSRARRFVEQTLGATVHKSEQGSTRYRFDEPQRLQDQVEMLVKGNGIAQTERQSLVQRVLRDGNASQMELLGIRHGLASAVRQGHITRQDYRRTVKLFSVEIARMTGGKQKAKDIRQMMQIQHTGQHHFVA